MNGILQWNMEEIALKKALDKFEKSEKSNGIIK